ncbi:MAG TPA: hypothetical protein VNF04_05070, partial [Stellaceae bacterium]|nr:hypothetical protein [Stellaceae bacterium]
ENKISAICASPAVKECIVGLTCTPETRRKQYRGKKAQQLIGDSPHFVILMTGLSAIDALVVERELFTRCITKPDLYAKYHPKKRDQSYHASHGGTVREGPVYCVYLAWQ